MKLYERPAVTQEWYTGADIERVTTLSRRTVYDRVKALGVKKVFVPGLGWRFSAGDVWEVIKDDALKRGRSDV